MIELQKTDQGLRLVPDDLEALQEAQSLDEALESNLCNGWTRIQPEQIGALTDGFLISDDWDEDDHGKVTRLGSVWWDADYAVTDTLAELKAGRTVIWRSGT